LNHLLKNRWISENSIFLIDLTMGIYSAIKFN